MDRDVASTSAEMLSAVLTTVAHSSSLASGEDLRVANGSAMQTLGGFTGMGSRYQGRPPATAMPGSFIDVILRSRMRGATTRCGVTSVSLEYPRFPGHQGWVGRKTKGFASGNTAGSAGLQSVQCRPVTVEIFWGMPGGHEWPVRRK